MANIKFKGDFADISETQLKYISGVFVEYGFKGVVSVQPVGGVGENFVANVKRLTAEKDGGTFKMLAKIAPVDEVQRATINTEVMFSNEIVMYSAVLPKLTELEIVAGVPEENRFKYCRCYGYSSEVPYEVLLLEDLEESGFIMLDKHHSLSDDSIKLVLENFAKLHSLTYVLKEVEAESYAALKDKLVNVWVLTAQDDYFQMFFSQFENETVKLLDNEGHKKIIKELLGNFTSMVELINKQQSESAYSIIQQGDAWINNILFVMKDEKPINCCVIDYQVSTESSPVTDLLYMIFNCTDHSTRKNNYHGWIDYYYSKLDEQLTQFGLKVEEVYPRLQLEQEIKTYAKLFFGVSVLVANIMMRETSEAALLESFETKDMDQMLVNSELGKLGEQSLERFRNTVEGLIESYKLFGFLD